MSKMDDQPLPEVLEACWSRNRVEALFDDLRLGAEVKHVQVRTASGYRTPEDSAVTLDRARELLNKNAATAIQIYYEYEGKSWCDTLMPLPDAVRIIRTVVSSDR